MNVRQIIQLSAIAICCWNVAFGFASTAVVSANRPYQGPAEEPTKAPYVFPVPIFIPTYPGDQPVSSKSPAASVPTRPAARASGERTYTIVSGDNPWTIAQKVYGDGTKSPIIMSANDISDPTKLKVGTVLRIPATDSSGQPLPTAAPTAVPTPPPLASGPAEIVEPTAAPTQAAPTPMTTATPAPSGGGTSFSGILSLLISIISALFLLGAIFSGTMAFLMHQRSERVARMTMMARRIRTR